MKRLPPPIWGVMRSQVAGAVAPNGRIQYTVDLAQPRGSRPSVSVCLFVSRTSKKLVSPQVDFHKICGGEQFMGPESEFIRFKK